MLTIDDADAMCLYLALHRSWGHDARTICAIPSVGAFVVLLLAVSCLVCCRCGGGCHEEVRRRGGRRGGLVVLGTTAVRRRMDERCVRRV